MQNAGDMMERLNHSGRRLSKSHRRIAAYITDHYDKAVFMTAARLGECVGVSESTVVRFASALGYEGYPQLQRSLQELVSHRLTANQRFERVTEIDPKNVLSTVLKSDMQNLHNTLEDLDPAVKTFSVTMGLDEVSDYKANVIKQFTNEMTAHANELIEKKTALEY